MGLPFSCKMIISHQTQIINITTTQGQLSTYNTKFCKVLRFCQVQVFYVCGNHKVDYVHLTETAKSKKGTLYQL